MSDPVKEGIAAHVALHYHERDWARRAAHDPNCDCRLCHSGISPADRAQLLRCKTESLIYLHDLLHRQNVDARVPWPLTFDHQHTSDGIISYIIEEMP